MKTASKQDLTHALIAIEGKPAADYHSLAGEWDYGDFILRFEYIPEQPDAAPARLRISIPLTVAKFPRDVFTPKCREIAARDFLARQFAAAAGEFSISMGGMFGGTFSIEKPGQQLLETNAVVLGEDYLEVRCTIELPLVRKYIPENAANELFMRKLPALVKKALTYAECDGQALVRWIETAEDEDAIRNMLKERGLAAFIADGSMLAWKGAKDRRSIVPFAAPPEHSITLVLPNRGPVTGMGIPKGITVIAGGWQQGKSTLLKAISYGVYNHIPGDGRELVATLPDAVMIQAEEGRRIERVDISPILPQDPGEPAGSPFSTGFASPALSMSANIMEALEIGTSLLLFDDETSSLPLAGGDPCMRELIGPSGRSPYTLAGVLARLRDQRGISSVVAGGTADMIAAANTVILMDRFSAKDVTDRARELAASKGATAPDTTERFPMPRGRVPMNRSLEPVKLDKRKSSPPGRDIIPYGDEYLDLSGLPQLVSKGQGRAIGRAIALVDRLVDGSPSLRDAIIKVMNRVNTVGLDALSNRLMGDLTMFRPQELAAAINRMRQLRIK